MEPSPEGWSITAADEVEWVPWGPDGDARAKVLAGADGAHVLLVEADAGYRGAPHQHEHAEFLYVVHGTLRTQGRTMHAGDAYAAAAGSTHDDFEAVTAAGYVLVFRL
jgi:quercetin dioxygenase-like cupin family protein